MADTMRHVLCGALVLFGLGACASETTRALPEPPTSTSTTEAPDDWEPADDAGDRGPSRATTTTTAPPPPPPTTTTVPPPPPESPEVSNARRHAESYLETMPFSRSGLIDQLEFEGYSSDAATTAVDGLGADWHAQAIRSAQSYLDVMPFSHSGLVDQLIYEGYTPDQAEHGVTGAGL